MILPWWAWLYLALAYLLWIGGIIDDYRDSPSLWRPAVSILSLLLITLFVFGCFSDIVAEAIGWYAPPLTLAVAGWEFWAARRDRQMMEKEKGKDGSPSESTIRMALLVNALIVLPGILAGIKLSWEMISSHFGLGHV